MTTRQGSEISVPIGQTVTIDESGTKDYDAETADHENGTCQSTEQVLDDANADAEQRPPKWLRTKRVLLVAVFPALAVILAMGSGYLKWLGDSGREAQTARVQSVQAATENSIAMLSYKPDDVDKLTAVGDRLTEPFKDEYLKLVTDVVIPGSKQAKISASATVPAAASMSASANHAVVLVFIDQSVVVGNDAPSTTSSAVRVTLEKDRDRWKISQFDPV
jgi:Mce-associated membrane protein